MDWINAELLPEHIVVRSLEEDIFDGLILHHLFRKSLLSAPGSPRRQSGPAWGSLGALCRALGRQLQDRPVGHSFLSSCHGAGTVNRQHSQSTSSRQSWGMCVAWLGKPRSLETPPDHSTLTKTLCPTP